MKKWFVLILVLLPVGCSPNEVSSGLTSKDRRARVLLERHAPSILRQYRIPDESAAPVGSGDESVKRGMRSWWIKGLFRGMDRPEYAYRLAARSESPSFALVVLLSRGAGYNPRVLHHVDAPVEDSTLDRRSAPTRLRRTDEGPAPPADRSSPHERRSYDSILLRIDGASVIRFSWDPTSEKFKKTWLSD